MIQNVHHVAFAVRDLASSLSVYTNVLGLQATIQEMGEYGVKLALIDVGGVLVELIQPTRADDPLGFTTFINDKGEGFHHIAYEVQDIEKTLDMLREKKVKLIDEKPKKGADGMIAFADKESTGGIQVEFVQRPAE